MNDHHAILETKIGPMYLTHPTEIELQDLIELLQGNDLDLRRLVLTSSDSYKSQGKEAIQNEWESTLLENKNDYEESLSNSIRLQSEGIISHPAFPKKDNLVIDPFNLNILEEEGIDNLRKTQLKNILILKHNDKIICSARVLPVEGSWELVSLITHKEFRRKGLAKLIIREILHTYRQRPLFSFQTINLVPYYMKCYGEGNPIIPRFEELPTALQRDLMYMNAFWGPNCIIRINS